MEEKILQARREFNKVIAFVTGEALTQELHSVEGEIFRMLLSLGRILLELFLRSVGTGHMGQTATMKTARLFVTAGILPGSIFRFSGRSLLCEPITSKMAPRASSPWRLSLISRSVSIRTFFKSG